MKQLNHLSLIVIIALFSFIASCSKKKEEVLPPPVVKLDSLPGSAKSQAFFTALDPIRIDYSVTSSDNLSGISFSESVTPNTVTGNNAPTRTTYDTPTSYKGPHTTQFPVGASLLNITITANDVKSKSGSATFIARSIIKDQALGGATYKEGLSYYSTLESKSYNDAQFAANKDKIDITFGFLSPTAGAAAANILISSDQRSNVGATKGTGGPKTYFKESTLTLATATAATIYNIKESANQSITIAEGKVYEFVSPNVSTKGLIEITKIVPGAGGEPSNASILFNYKVIKYK